LSFVDRNPDRIARDNEIGRHPAYVDRLEVARLEVVAGDGTPAERGDPEHSVPGRDCAGALLDVDAADLLASLGRTFPDRCLRLPEPELHAVGPSWKKRAGLTGSAGNSNYSGPGYEYGGAVFAGCAIVAGIGSGS
jgi:hypothetical protein